jgi:putative methionine-R-sulfoxide reductase with GAF domain
MAHSSTFYTLAAVAKRLGEDEDWLYEISCGMEDAEGCIGVIDADQDYVVAFDEVGIEKLKRLIAEHKARSRQGRTNLDG